MMSTKHEEIDLNVDAVSSDRENEVDTPVIGDSVAETLTEPFTAQGEVQSSNVDEVRVCDSAEVVCDLNICGNDVNMDGEGVEREVDVLDKVVNVEKGNENLDRGFDAKVEENYGKCGDDFSSRYENEVEGAPVAERASSEAQMDCDRDTNVVAVGEVVKQDSDHRGTDESLHEKFEKATTDGLENDSKIEENDGKYGKDFSRHDLNEVEGTPVAERASGQVKVDCDRSTNVGPAVEVSEDSDKRDTDESLHEKFEGATSDGSENEEIEIDTQTKIKVNEDQLVDVHVSEVRDPSDVLNESYAVSLVVDLNPYVTTDRTRSSNGNAKLVTSNPEFCAGDLVWGKVRSHPWWPGQIFNPSAASQKAKKYFKKDSYLIAYFGDQTFAWNEESKLKPFREHFAQMEKQTSSEDFHYAVDCTLEEVSRRVEFGLACSCIPEEAYAKVKNQIIANCGIRKESSTIHGGDSFSKAASFEPVKLSEKIRTLARLPYNCEVDRLEFETLKAQLSSFFRWKGCLQLPEFNMLGGLLENDAEIPLSGEVTQSDAPDFVGDKQVSSKMGKLKSQDGSSLKRKRISGDGIRPSKKEKSLMDLLSEKRANISNGKQGTDSKDDELISSSSGKKRKSVDSIADDMALKHKKLDSISDDVTVKQKKSDMSAVKHEKGDVSLGAANKCLLIKKTFGVGTSILKVASQLNGSSPIFKSGDLMPQQTVVKNKGKEKSLFRKSHSEKQFPSDESSPDELLSQLCMAARDPMKGCNFLLSVVSFFLEFRNSVSLEQSHEEVSGDKSQKTWTNSETTEMSESGPMKDTYWTDRIIQNNPEEQQELEVKHEAGELLHETPSSPVGPPSAVQLSTHLESASQTAGENFEQGAVKPLDPLDGCCSEDPTPTALILNFTDLDSVPSKENLNEIFSRYGPLNELETEVMKSKRAKVVFKRRADAEAAFSSAGKYSIFGPSLVSYCLKYMPSKPSSRATKRGRKAATSGKDNAT